MSRPMPQHLRILLKDVARKHKIDLPIEVMLADWCAVDEKSTELLIDVLVEELSETGLGNDDEPNQRGLQIEELIDLVNCYRRPA